MRRKNYSLVAIVLLALISGLILGNLLASKEKRKFNDNFGSIFKNILKTDNKISEMLRLIDSYYVDTVDINNMTEEVAVDLIAKLDPHSVYIPAEELETVNNELEGSFSGIGVQFNIQNDTITIVSVISGGPSEKVGLLAGDRII